MEYKDVHGNPFHPKPDQMVLVKAGWVCCGLVQKLPYKSYFGWQKILWIDPVDGEMVQQREALRIQRSRNKELREKQAKKHPKPKDRFKPFVPFKLARH